MSKKTQEKVAAELADLESSKATWYPLKKRHRESSTPAAAPTAANDDKYSDESSLENDGLDEYFMGDEADRNYLLGLPEFEREKILFERQEKRRDIEERNNMRLAERARKRAQSGRDLEEDEDEQPAKKKHKSNQRAALDDLKKKRSKKAARDDIYDEEDDEESEEDRKRSKKSRKIYGDDEDDVDFMDVEETEKKPKERKDKEVKEPKEASIPPPKSRPDEIDPQDFQRQFEEAPPLEEFRKIVVKRAQVERWFGEPFWKDCIKGLYCRVSTGLNPQLPGDDKNVYRIAEIAELQESSKSYKLGTKDCNQIAILSLQGSRKGFEFRYLSNHGITQEEYDYFKKVQIRSRRSLPGLEDIERLYKQVEEATNYRYTETDVSEVVRKNLAKKDSVHFAKDKTRLLEEIAEQTAEGNTLRVQELQNRFDEILKKEEEQRKRAEMSRPVKVSELNLARRSNYSKQQDEERDQTLKREKDEMLGRISIDDDPFSRRKTYGGDFKKTAPKDAPSGVAGAASADLNAASDISSIISDLPDLDASSTPVKAVAFTPTPLLTSSSNSNKKAISLEEYKRKKMQPKS